MNPDLTPELETLFSFLRFPSISTDSGRSADVRACAEWLVAKLTSLGMAHMPGLTLSDARIHAPHRNFPIGNFEAVIKPNQALLKELSL